MPCSITPMSGSNITMTDHDLYACRLSVREVTLGFYQLASGLEHMHGRGIADQDVHRGNVLISFNDSVWKKADLGSAARCKVDEGWNWMDAKRCR